MLLFVCTTVKTFDAGGGGGGGRCRLFAHTRASQVDGSDGHFRISPDGKNVKRFPNTQH